MTNQLWFHGRMTGLNPQGDPVSDEVPFSSVSEQWLRNHLAQKATNLIRLYNFRPDRAQDPNTITLLHPKQACVSYVMTIDACLDGNPDCQGECQSRAREASDARQ